MVRVSIGTLGTKLDNVNPETFCIFLTQLNLAVPRRIRCSTVWSLVLAHLQLTRVISVTLFECLLVAEPLELALMQPADVLIPGCPPAKINHVC